MSPVLVHGLAGDLVRPDWPPLADEEVREVLARYGAAGAGRAVVAWHSPRPFSAAGLVDCGGRRIFIKRHDERVRTAGQLAVEHAFARHLGDRGLGLPPVLRAVSGATAVSMGGAVYEAHGALAGADLYRDAMSWSPFRSLGHAGAAGAALARLHAAATSFRRPPRPPAVLMSSLAVVAAPDPVAAVARLAAQRPGLGRYLERRRWEEDMGRAHLPFIRSGGPLVSGARAHWAHGDWHPSNLAWAGGTTSAEVTGVFDLGLCNRTSVAHDLAVALERSTVDWLDLSVRGQAEADLDAAAALLGGYTAVAPIGRHGMAALAATLPVAHVEYALSEVEYFAAVVGSPERADVAYDQYFMGHTLWFTSGPGSALLEFLRRRPGAEGKL